jgi:hypothetical protein
MKTKETEYQVIYNNARIAGIEAVQKCNPTPMIVGTPTTMFGNDIDYTQKTYYVADGVCGFAWVSVRPGNCPFANWLKKSGLGRPDRYAGGVCIWISEFNQSMQKKESYAYAFCSVLRNCGIKAYANSRMD